MTRPRDNTVPSEFFLGYKSILGNYTPLIDFLTIQPYAYALVIDHEATHRLSTGTLLKNQMRIITAKLFTILFDIYLSSKNPLSPNTTKQSINTFKILAKQLRYLISHSVSLNELYTDLTTLVMDKDFQSYREKYLQAQIANYNTLYQKYFHELRKILLELTAEKTAGIFTFLLDVGLFYAEDLLVDVKNTRTTNQDSIVGYDSFSTLSGDLSTALLRRFKSIIAALIHALKQGTDIFNPNAIINGHNNKYLVEFFNRFLFRAELENKLAVFQKYYFQMFDVKATQKPIEALGPSGFQFLISTDCTYPLNALGHYLIVENQLTPARKPSDIAELQFPTFRLNKPELLTVKKEYTTLGYRIDHKETPIPLFEMALFCYAILQGYFNNGAFTCPFEKIKYIRRIETKRVDSVVSEDYYDTCHYACERGKFFKDVFISLKQAGLIKDVISGNCCIS